MNTTVTATGMQVKAQSSAALVIAKSAATLANSDAITVNWTGSGDLDAAATVLLPATHAVKDQNYTNKAGSTVKNPESGLIYVDNAEEINSTTGLTNGETLTYDAATNVSGQTPYYTDRTVYIASKGQAMDTALKVNLSVDAATKTALATAATELLNAVAVDFYVSASDDDTIGTFVNTIHLKDCASTGASSDLTLVAAATGCIPEASATAFVKVTMRIYVDGALEKTAGSQAYVANAKVTTEGIQFQANFTSN